MSPTRVVHVAPRWPVLILRLLLGWILAVPVLTALFDDPTAVGLQAIAEVVVGVGVALGIATRPLGIVGILLMATHIEGIRPSAGPSLWLLLLLIVVLADGGKSFGLDAVFARRRAKERPGQALDREFSVWPMVILRIRLAWTFLASSIVWLGYESPAGYLDQAVHSALDRGVAAGFYEPFLTGVVLQHTVLFATLSRLGEFFVFVSMAFGVATRAGAAVGMFLMLNYGLMQVSALRLHIGPGLWFTLFLVVFFTAPGRVLGVDRWLERRLGRFWLWSP